MWQGSGPMWADSHRPSFADAQHGSFADESRRVVGEPSHPSDAAVPEAPPPIDDNDVVSGPNRIELD